MTQTTNDPKVAGGRIESVRFCDKVRGVYLIACGDDGPFYVGCAKNVKHRWLTHRSNLRRGIHSNRPLQEWYNEHGEGELRWGLIEECAHAERIERERFWIWVLGAPLNPTTRSRQHAERIGAAIRNHLATTFRPRNEKGWFV